MPDCLLDVFPTSLHREACWKVFPLVGKWAELGDGVQLFPCHAGGPLLPLRQQGGVGSTALAPVPPPQNIECIYVLG